MKCIAAAALILCTVPMAEARRAPPEARLPVSCQQIKDLVRMAGSVQAAEIYAAQAYGIHLTPAQRRAAIACLSR